jgi:chemotaxis protein MotB
MAITAKSRRGQHEAHESQERWLLTYSDMITLLMVFFIVLYSMANTDLKKFGEVAQSMKVAFNAVGIGSGALVGDKESGGNGNTSPLSLFQNLPPQQRDFVKASSELTAFAVAAGVEGEISVNMNLEGIIVSLSNGLVFEPGSADLRPESLGTLHKVAEILRGTDNPVRVEGNTDNTATNNPLYPTNWELSVARAVTIVRYLAEKEAISPGRLSAAGYGEFKPIVPNDSRANRALNRRADIVIIYPNASRQFSIGMSAAQTSGPVTNTTTSQAR